MNQSSLKNMVVLKNLPSNLVEEAIIILKANKKIKKLEKIEKNKKVEEKNIIKEGNEYILKEAEILVNSYISGLEEKRKVKNNETKKMQQSFRRVKNYAYITSFIVFIESILLIIK